MTKELKQLRKEMEEAYEGLQKAATLIQKLHSELLIMEEEPK